MLLLPRTLWALLLLVSLAHAQFQFFEQMFGGGSQQERGHPGSQNVPSDSSRYQQQWEAGGFSMPFWDSDVMPLEKRLLTANQQTAINIYVPALLPACIFHTIAPVHTQMWRRRLNWVRGVPSVYLGVAISKERQRGRLS